MFDDWPLSSVVAVIMLAFILAYMLFIKRVLGQTVFKKVSRGEARARIFNVIEEARNYGEILIFIDGNKIRCSLCRKELLLIPRMDPFHASNEMKFRRFLRRYSNKAGHTMFFHNCKWMPKRMVEEEIEEKKIRKIRV